MNVWAHQSGTASRAAPASPVPAVRPPEQPRELPEVQPAKRASEDPRGKIREQVLAERGLDMAVLMKMAPQARLDTEIEIIGEIAKRLGAQRLLDIRV
jgi:hypothetical protein